ncbi:hypothetical protein H257_14721 [Aphanomyces astaci]|uniref:Peptidase M14 domain-containing protein n=1 Tax=Aphanomyces astaci TaxID=112090 RepID=W4FQ40_APHAT|nr:hypothetical protein H257_14721 [Aphanomyces astaci]ETV69585.1 hypothetical protein H257_14721 [Aphanomyces astaci]|eukprot:XP_009840912.1 hypothetical protein H257_14721 [Aphanomyces astaci]
MKVSLLSAIALFAAAATAQTNNTIAGINGRARTLEEVYEVDDGEPDSTRPVRSTTASAIDQIYEFTDALVAQNPTLLSKIAISKTYNGVTIYGYKLTKGHSQSLYFQAQPHAREWIAGAWILISLASILDDITNKKPTAADYYDLYFVSIVNFDGFENTWNGFLSRDQRKNANGVDLNRNWLTKFPNPEIIHPDDDTYPGLKPFSEPETAGINDWFKTKRNEIQGFIDVHSYMYPGLILYPYADNDQPIGGGFDEKFDVLGRGLESVLGEYTVIPLAKNLSPSYGLFQDYAFREFKKPALTFEIVGDDFVVDVTTIKTHGLEVYKGINQFAKEVTVFNG